MTDNIESLILEHLKRFQTGQERGERKLEEVISRLGALELNLASTRRDFAHSEENTAVISARVDRLNERLERIERRPELS